MSAASVLMTAYDEWVREEQPEPAAARAPLRALQQALHECQRKGGRLASVPLLLQEKELVALKPAAALVSLSSLLPELPAEDLLGPAARPCDSPHVQTA